MMLTILFCVLLKTVDEDGEVTKADMFYKQTIKPEVTIDRVETAVEALNISISEFGEVNIPFMLSIYTPDINGYDEDKNNNFSDENRSMMQRDKN